MFFHKIDNEFTHFVEQPPALPAHIQILQIVPTAKIKRAMKKNGIEINPSAC